MVEDLNGAREGVLFFGPEEALILLPASRELDRELDLPGQVGGDFAGDVIDGSITIRSETACDHTFRVDGQIDMPEI